MEVHKQRQRYNWNNLTFVIFWLHAGVLVDFNSMILGCNAIISIAYVVINVGVIEGGIFHFCCIGGQWMVEVPIFWMYEILKMKRCHTRLVVQLLVHLPIYKQAKVCKQGTCPS